MIVLPCLFLGAALGAFMAYKRGGNRLDMLQYAAALAIALGIAGIAATIILHRVVVG